MPSDRPPTHLCDRHSGRPTQPSDCPACDRKREMALLKRRVADLEDENGDLRETLATLTAAAFETRMRTSALAAVVGGGGRGEPNPDGVDAEAPGGEA